MSAPERCVRKYCGHEEAEHHGTLGFCEVLRCPCLMFVSQSEAEADRAEERAASGDYDEDDLDELDFDHGESAA